MTAPDTTRTLAITREVQAGGDVTCHPGRDMGWTCVGCEALMCDRCDGTDNGSGLCWECFSEEGIA